ncbi:MAG TPA: hypothetical protein ENO14_05420 [Chromatiales bacterium]|nr:hypothetical protein [Chromatiales bacterium]
MKATIDVPEDLYRRVKAKSAMEGRPVREVAIQLFRRWVEEPTTRSAETARDATKPPDWVGSLRRYAENAGGRHDMQSIRDSIRRGRSAPPSRKQKS